MSETTTIPQTPPNLPLPAPPKPAGFRFHEKLTRAKMIEKLKAADQIPELEKNFILAKIDAIPATFEVIQVSIAGLPHKSGFNFSFTACELTS